MGRPTSIAPGQFQQTVRIGSSIGPNSGSGTLGLYGKTTSSVVPVEILGLTNYNVIRTEYLTKGKFYCTFQASLYSISDYLKDYDENEFVNADPENLTHFFAQFDG